MLSGDITIFGRDDKRKRVKGGGIIGGVIGLAMQLTMAVVNMLGFLVSSQVGFSMAQMNDPVNGQQSDVISGLLGLVAILIPGVLGLLLFTRMMTVPSGISVNVIRSPGFIPNTFLTKLSTSATFCTKGARKNFRFE